MGAQTPEELLSTGCTDLDTTPEEPPPASRYGLPAPIEREAGSPPAPCRSGSDLGRRAAPAILSRCRWPPPRPGRPSPRSLRSTGARGRLTWGPFGLEEGSFGTYLGSHPLNLAPSKLLIAATAE